MINFKVVLTNELGVAMMDEEKDFALHVWPNDNAYYVIHGLTEEEVNAKIAKLIKEIGI